VRARSQFTPNVRGEENPIEHPKSNPRSDRGNTGGPLAVRFVRCRGAPTKVPSRNR
jgi:hypothetical protein